MAHVSQSHVLLLLSLITPLLAINDLFRDIPRLEKINGKISVKTSFHWSIKDLLDHIVNDVMQEVVPREAKKEALQGEKKESVWELE
jgi:hypothetical protein